MSRTVLALVFGGRSPEHDVSLVSARGVLEMVDSERYETVLVGIDRDGCPRTAGRSLLEGGLDRGEGTAVAWPACSRDRRLRRRDDGAPIGPEIDVVFPIVHGTGGEDGTLQGVFEAAGLPYVGAGVLGTALAIDKDRARRMLEQASIPVVRDAVFDGAGGHDRQRMHAAASELGYPLFVKPARAGSSLGISRVTAPEALDDAIDRAVAVDDKIVLEEAIPDPREIEIALLGPPPGEVSVPGEIVPHDAFYSFEAKYEDPNSELIVPAPIEPELVDEIAELARRAYRALDLSGMARVDFLLARSGGRLVLNEVNTHPGFTPISMYPRLWAASGVPGPELIDRLVACAIGDSRRGPRPRIDPEVPPQR